MSKYRERSSRTSSASRVSDRGVKPTRSANSTDTTRRSVTASVIGGGGAAEGAFSPRGVPHSLQKRASEAFGVPQEGHGWRSGAPQLLQNFAPRGSPAHTLRS